jgi:hypothetical protein
MSCLNSYLNLFNVRLCTNLDRFRGRGKCFKPFITLPTLLQCFPTTPLHERHGPQGYRLLSLYQKSLLATDGINIYYAIVITYCSCF